MYSGTSKDKYDKYFKDCDNVVAYEIERAILFDNPKSLKVYNIKIVPQSYIYIK